MTQFQWFRLVTGSCVLAFAVSSFGSLFGQDDAASPPNDSKPGDKKPAADVAEKTEEKPGDEKPPAEKPEPEKPEPEKPTEDPQAEWKRLAARKLEIAKQLRQLQGEFNKIATSRDRKKEIQTKFRTLITEYQLDVEARMGELADAVYQADPNNVEAAEAVMLSAFNKNQYQQALDVAKNLLESGKKSKYAGNMAINIAGAACFSLNEFEQATTFLNQAEEAKQLNSYGEGFQEQLLAYTEFWKTEQETRASEAKLKGDKQLPLVELTIGSGKKELGKVLIELFENEAPNTVANFISIVESKDNNYNGVKFHRVMPNFMVQTGNLEASGKQPLDYTIECECYEKNARKHFRGSLSMALKGKDTGDSQFYITHLPTYWLNEEVTPNSVHTVFGRVVKGMDVIDRLKQGDVIKTAKILFKRPHEYKPETVPNEEPKP